MMTDLLPLARFAGSGFHAALGANRSEATPRTTDVSALTLALAATLSRYRNEAACRAPLAMVTALWFS
ncbi:MAG: hypothetical protein MZW92_16685 [Comamonadaceae bacterium]|nr:hypothetical protein [Comamonadaceae bacterium]